MPARALAWLLLTLLPVVVPAGTVAAAGDPPPPDTVNEFIPENRDLSECVSALPKPGCGSEARGGWRQVLVLVAILVALAFIVWRVVRAARRGRNVAARDA